MYPCEVGCFAYFEGFKKGGHKEINHFMLPSRCNFRGNLSQKTEFCVVECVWPKYKSNRTNTMNSIDFNSCTTNYVCAI